MSDRGSSALRGVVVNMLVGVSAGALLFAGSAACAQESADQPADMEVEEAALSPGSGEIVVTARKRTERLMDVPMSVSAVSGDAMQAMGISDVADLEKVTPGFSYAPSYLGTPIFTLRGVGFQNPSVAAPPAVSVYFDQAPIPYPAEARSVGLDISRVEVLKGPQGTLFGQNATGGAINYVVNRPTDRLEGELFGSIGNFNAVELRGILSGPITETVRARAAIQWETRGDYKHSWTRDETAGQRDFLMGRAIIDWTPSDTLALTLSYNGWRDKSDALVQSFIRYKRHVPGGYNALQPQLDAYEETPFDNRIADWWPDRSIQRDDRFHMGSLRADLDLPFGTLTSISTYSDYRQDTPVTDGTNTPNFFIQFKADIRSFSQELRLSGSSINDRLQWMVGANYSDDRSRENGVLYSEASTAGVGSFLLFTGGYEINNQDVRTTAGFASLDYEATDTLGLHLSARYSDSRNDFGGCAQDDGSGMLAAAFNLIWSTDLMVPGQCVTYNAQTGAGELVRLELDEDNVSWRAGLDWEASPDFMVYANVTQGFKAGSFATLPYATVDKVLGVGQEKVIAYEAGFKVQPAPAMQLTGAAYYYDYFDKQLLAAIDNAPLGPAPSLVTIPKSKVVGAEVSLNWRPVYQWQLTAAGNYSDTKVTSDTVVYSPNGELINIQGSPFPVSPKWQISLDTQYDVDLSSDLIGYLGGTIVYRSKTNGAFSNDPIYRIAGYALLDLRAGVRTADEAWTLALWARNVTDKDYATSVSALLDVGARAMGMPRTYGASVTRRF